MSGIDTISITPDPEVIKEQENVTYRSALRVSSDSGHHRVFQSGPTEETIECRRHERVETTRGVSFNPSVGPPPPSRLFFNF